MTNNNKRNIDFKKQAEKVFDTESGRKVLAYLKESYIDGSCVDSTPELTYYRLGQKELVQSLIDTLKNQDVLDDVTLVNYFDEDL